MSKSHGSSSSTKQGLTVSVVKFESPEPVRFDLCLELRDVGDLLLRLAVGVLEGLHPLPVDEPLEGHLGAEDVEVEC